jgi:hypothetical protein
MYLGVCCLKAPGQSWFFEIFETGGGGPNDDVLRPPDDRKRQKKWAAQTQPSRKVQYPQQQYPQAALPLAATATALSVAESV